MRAPLSIVIPTLNSEAGLPDTLASLMEGVAQGIIREVIVSDGGSFDRTLEIARDVGAEIVSGPASRGGQLRRGANAANGEWFLFLHSDTKLAAGWVKAVSSFAARPDQAGYGKLKFAQGGIKAGLIARGANLRSSLMGLPYGDQSLLISKALYEEIGGYRDQPLMEDVAIARALRGRLKPAGCDVETSAERYERDGYTRRVLRNWITLTRYLLGASPETLAKGYSATSSS
ncbi:MULTISPECIES: TIGR04283 family arsenosugar biosynthesis glycosyltransferase [Halocynthiibacter]|uniref:TIGR04283 family arsenosugar biosynthesis glycosyltransferase n=1 Tax=Halocynthiibacter halioticoli TaxID=2986804 RepID=A0AAE3J2E9_9RHOB|nr:MULTISPECIES: TIGR04283 family arsenosugar biosynthesis glycosyltransferase [Halocynthiibacter]MCV6825001.1 TIGR04283 family arsenosugar biosynthesis glycosyltransferase [Halocynthiibacter halioticoli]MCW4058002.1 TIGR04283 family arsenosugar biosynthesis glycosyltransferase [Halocynthiibacter sp. SDUM655004]